MGRNFSNARVVKTGVAMQTGPGKTAAINVTPMIDILLVLLITFMVLPQRTAGLPSQIPQPAPENQATETNPLDVVLTIARDRSLQINSQPVEAAALDAKLRVVFASRPSGVLFVEGVSELEFADVARVIDTARGAGVRRIGIITEHETEAPRP
jgi:biopolymer transport protein ExbD